MDAKSMGPFGAALLDYFRGDTAAQITFRREDGLEGSMPAAYLFRLPADFRPIDRAAVDRARGWVLDIGAGTGVHTLVMQERGLRVTAIDIDPQVVAIMRERGAKDARQADIFKFHESGFDTLFLLNHGIGLTETLAGLDRFLARAHKWAAPNGQIVLDSLDVFVTDDPKHLAYHETKRRAGHYPGEIRMQVEYKGTAGPFFGWLQVDPDTLKQRAAFNGWDCEVILRESTGDYLAALKQLAAR